MGTPYTNSRRSMEAVAPQRTVNCTQACMQAQACRHTQTKEQLEHNAIAQALGQARAGLRAPAHLP